MSERIQTACRIGIASLLTYIPEAMHHIIPVPMDPDNKVAHLELIIVLGDVAVWIHRLETMAHKSPAEIQDIMGRGLLLAIFTDDEPSLTAFHQEYLD